jgi:hypothetical protein
MKEKKKLSKMQELEKEFIICNLELALSGRRTVCHGTVAILVDELKKKGFNVKAVRGFYRNQPKNIEHSWIEFEDKILETDCRQLREQGDMMPDERWAILDKSEFEHRYHGGN